MEQQDNWLVWAERIDALRIFPRLILFFYLAFFAHAWYFVVSWFMAYDWKALPTDTVIGSVAVTAVAGFPAIILGVLSKVLIEVIRVYLAKPSFTLEDTAV